MRMLPNNWQGWFIFTTLGGFLAHRAFTDMGSFIASFIMGLVIYLGYCITRWIGRKLCHG